MAEERTRSAYDEIKHFVRRYGAVVVVVILAALFLWRVRAELPPFIIAIIFAVLLEPAMRFLDRRGISRTWAATLIVTVPIVLVGILLFILTRAAFIQVTQLTEDVQRYRNEFAQFTKDLAGWWSGVVNALGLPPGVEKSIGKLGPWLAHQLGVIGGYLTGFVGKIIWIVIIPIATFYFLADGPRAREKVLMCLSEPNRSRATDLAGRIGGVLAGYVRGIVTASCLYGAFLAIVFVVLGLPYALVMGTVAAVLFVLPYVGPLTTLGVAVTLAYLGREATWAGSWATVVAGIAVLGSNQFFDNYLTPRIVGSRVGLHPLLSIFAMISGYSLMGLGGMILAIPLAASIQVVILYLFPALGSPSAQGDMAKEAAAMPGAAEPVPRAERPKKGPRSPS